MYYKSFHFLLYMLLVFLIYICMALCSIFESDMEIFLMTPIKHNIVSCRCFQWSLASWTRGWILRWWSHLLQYLRVLPAPLLHLLGQVWRNTSAPTAVIPPTSRPTISHTFEFTLGRSLLPVRCALTSLPRRAISTVTWAPMPRYPPLTYYLTLLINLPSIHKRVKCSLIWN